jgi:signal peptidase I
MKISPEIKKELIEWIQTISIALLVAFLVRQFLFQPYRVQMGSMLPTLHESNLIIVNKLIYRFNPPNRGDIVVFRPPNNAGPGVFYIKRIIGLPGESIEIKDGNVFVNNEQIKEETYLNIDTPGIFGPRKLQKDEYFVMGDHRNNSLDSREFGPVQFSAISGKAVFILWPPKDVKVLGHVVY